MLRFIHAVLTDSAHKFGLFKLRGVNTQFIAALSLYRLFAKSHGDIPENHLDWAIHDILETLLKPVGLGTRPIDCPTDQMTFLWAFLSRDRYRISRDLSSHLAGCKFGFRCTEIHAARVQVQQHDKGSSFYGDLSDDGGESDEDDYEEMTQEKDQNAAREFHEPDIQALLEKLSNLSPEGV